MELVKRVFLLLSIVCVSELCAQPNAKIFQITVVVQNLKAPAKLILTVWEINQWMEYTAEASDGNFVLKGSLKEPSFAFLVMKYGTESDKPPRAGNVTEVFIGNSPMTIQTNDSLKLAAIKGGHLEEELQELDRNIAAWKENRKAPTPETEEPIAAFVKKHPSSFVSLHAIRNFSMENTFIIDAKFTEPLYQLLTPELKNTETGKALYTTISIARRTAIGAMAPDFVQADTLGSNVELRSLRGQYVLIDFWASWCKPCRKENPTLVRTFNEFKDKNFMILGVSLDNNKASWTKAIRKDNLTWKHTSDLKFWKNAVAIQYGVQTVPQNFLIDPSGKIIGKNIPADELSSWLKGIIR